MKKHLLTLLFVFALMMGANAQKVNPDFVDGMIYMKLVDTYPLNFAVDEQNGRSIRPESFPFLTDIFKKYDVVYVGQTLYRLRDPKLLRTLTISFKKADKVDEFVAELNAVEQVEYAEKRSLKHTCDVKPNDPYYKSYSYSGGTLDYRWHLDKIFAGAAWDLQQGDPSVKVAVVDNAVYGAHEDLGISSSNLCTIVGTWSSYYGGYTSISEKTGTANPPSSVNQTASKDAYEWSHGTHCAGLVGAKSNNGVGIASIGSGVTLMGVRITDDDGYLVFACEGVEWAAANGADVISMSFGGPSADQTEKTVMAACYNKGIILLAAAGNEGDEDNYMSYPACFSTVISVASVNGNGKLSYFSQYGTGRADIAAPGGFATDDDDYLSNVLSTTYTKCWYLSNYISGLPFDGKCYDGMQGTSMATPIAAGLCGLLKSACPSLTPAQAKSVLQTTQQKLASGSHTIDGHGYINAYAAVKYVQDNICPTACAAPENLSATEGKTSITLNWSAVTNANYYVVLRSGVQVATTTKTSYADNNVKVGTTYSYAVQTVCQNGQSDASDLVSATAGNTCSYMNYPISTPVVYTTTKEGDEGYVCGTNAYGDAAKANHYAYYGKGTVSKLKITLGALDGTSGSVGFVVWADNGGTPGAVLGSKYVTLNKIASDYNTATAEYEVTFDSPIPVNGSFFAGLELTSAESYFSVVCEQPVAGLENSAWELYNGVWNPFTDSWEISTRMGIYPYVCGSKVGVEETEAVDFTLYPNPANDFITITVPGELLDSEISLYDMTGKCLHTQLLNDIDNSISINTLASGIYFVKIGNMTKKFVKE